MLLCGSQQLLSREFLHWLRPRAAAVTANMTVQLLLLLLFCSTKAAAYVPGIAPTDFSQGQNVPVQIASLQSVQGVLPVDPYSPPSPFCRPATIEVEENNLGQILLSDRVKNTPFELTFLSNSLCKTLCKDNSFGSKEQTFMLRLIKEHYHYQFIVDQLYVLLRHYRQDGSSAFSFGTPVGFKSDGVYYFYNHFRLLLYYHSNTDAAGKQIHRIVGFEIVPYSVEQTVEADGSLSCYVPSSFSKNPEGARAAAGAASSSAAAGEGVSSSSAAAAKQQQETGGAAGSATDAATAGGGSERGAASRSAAEEVQLGDLITEQIPLNGVPRNIAFTYDVLWQRSSTPWSQRWDAYLKNTRDSPIIHWFSIVNSLVVVLLLSGLVAMIMLRVLYRDIAKYNELLVDEEEAEETGWKLLHGDVFRKPAHSTVLAALAGSGIQLIGMAFVTVIFAGLGVVSPAYRGSLLQTMLLLWTVMGAAAGYTSARLYKMFRSTHWKMTTIRTALMFPGVVFAIFFLLNLVLWIQRSSAAVSFSALLTLLVLWFGISTPLVFLGAYVGFRQPPISLPVRINKIPRQIPQQPWFLQPALCSLLGGALPFGAMFTELFFLFSSIWQHRFYYLFGFLFLVLVILCVTCAEISITFVYFQLVCEDYLWWWRSFLCSATSGVYVLLYAVYYFHSRLKLTHATGALIYFGYSLIIAYACFILTGAIGFLASFFFLRKIYGSIKVD